MSDLSYLWVLQQQPVLGQEHQSSGGQVFHHVHGSGRQLTDRNQSQLRSQSNLDRRNAPHLFSTYAAIPRARGILPLHNKPELPNPGTSNSETWRISDTKVSEQNNIWLFWLLFLYLIVVSLLWDDATVRSLSFPPRPRTLLQSSPQTVGTGRRGPGLVSTSRNRSLRQA